MSALIQLYRFQLLMTSEILHIPRTVYCSHFILRKAFSEMIIVVELFQ
jgi:hypothetical protein